MNIIKAIKAKLLNSVGEDEALIKKKKQFNVTIEAEIIDQVHYLASRYGAPLGPTAAHMLQVGAYYMGNALEDTQKRDILSTHLIEAHLIGGIGPDDDSGILVIGEKSDYWKLLEISKHVLQRYKKYCQAPKITRRTGDIRYMQKAEEDLLKATVGFAMYLQKQSTGSPTEVETDQGHQEPRPESG